jgi:hypothetical protein
MQGGRSAFVAQRVSHPSAESAPIIRFSVIEDRMFVRGTGRGARTARIETNLKRIDPCRNPL